MSAPIDALVIGGSGAVGRFLLRRLQAQRRATLALSRGVAPAWSGGWSSVHWTQAALTEPSLRALPPARVLFNAGPLDLLADACVAGLPVRVERLVVLSSLSIAWKRDSPSAAERALVQRLEDAESRLRAAGQQAGVPLVVLRPGMIYGAGIDRTLSRLLQLARRWHCLPWPHDGRGVRCPVHADDIAAAMLAASDTDGLGDDPIALPGPERMPYDRLIDRLLRARGGRALRLPLPLPTGLLTHIARTSGRWSAPAAVMLRSRQDQVADAAGWVRLGIKPRAFSDAAEDFTPWGQAGS